MRLLIIDDNENDRVLIKRRLPENVETREAGTMGDAWTALMDEGWPADVILLDLHLPDGDGPVGESWNSVRDLSRYAPVIVVSAQSLSDDPLLGRKAKEAGATNFTSKELILLSPENLLRQLDWATCPAGRTLAAASRNPAAPSELVTFNPNGVGAILARLMAQQEAMHQENQTAGIQRQAQLDRIEAQTTKTNGRVNKLEDRNKKQDWTLAAMATVFSIVGGLFLLLFGDQLKERLLMDKEAVRRIATEQVAAGGQKTPVAAGKP